MLPSHLRRFVIALTAAGLIGPGAGAALKKYALQFHRIDESTNLSPSPDFNLNPAAPGARTVIDDSGPSPILKTFKTVVDPTITTIVPELGGFIFTSGNTTDGPTGEFTGTGSTDTTIAWGLLTGWTITGTWWCKSSPAFICGLGARVNLESVDPIVTSPFFDMGTWTFHGTGFTGTPHIVQTFQLGDPGNGQYVFRGRLLLDGTIPALPVWGLSALGGALVFGGLAALRRRNR